MTSEPKAVPDASPYFLWATQDRQMEPVTLVRKIQQLYAEGMNLFVIAYKTNLDVTAITSALEGLRGNQQGQGGCQ